MVSVRIRACMLAGLVAIAGAVVPATAASAAAGCFHNPGNDVDLWCDFTTETSTLIKAYDPYGGELGEVRFSINPAPNPTIHMVVCNLGDPHHDFVARVDPGTYPTITYPDAYGGDCKVGNIGYHIRKVRAELGNSASNWELAP